MEFGELLDDNASSCAACDGGCHNGSPLIGGCLMYVGALPLADLPDGAPM